MSCYKKDGSCGPYEMYPCSLCPASKPGYIQNLKTGDDIMPLMMIDGIREYIEKKLLKMQPFNEKETKQSQTKSIVYENNEEAPLTFIDLKDKNGDRKPICMQSPQIKNIIINGTTTICILDDGSKGIAKLLPEDTYSFEIGFQVAYLKALNKSILKNLKKY